MYIVYVCGCNVRTYCMYGACGKYVNTYCVILYMCCVYCMYCTSYCMYCVLCAFLQTLQIEASAGMNREMSEKEWYYMSKDRERLGPYSFFEVWFVSPCACAPDCFVYMYS